MSDVTRILSEIKQGDPSAADELLPLVYDELRKLAAARLKHEKPGQTLDATALVHEAYLRLVAVDAQGQHWNGRAHFFGAAAEAMRRILLNRARDKNREKRGGRLRRINFDEIQIAMDTPSQELIALDEAIEALLQEDRLTGELVKLPFFAGLTIKQAAEMLRMSVRTANRQWAYARAWIYAHISSDR